VAIGYGSPVDDGIDETEAAAPFVHGWSPPADPRVDEGASPRAIREAVRLPSPCRNRCDLMAAGLFAERCILLVVSLQP
jgi:hypothetical protein